MKQEFGIFGNNLVNRAGTVIPASAYMHAHEHKTLAQHRAGQLIGEPSHIQHDMHRLHAWCKIVGLLVDGHAVSVFGELLIPEETHEIEALKTVAAEYWAHHHVDGMSDYKNDLLSRLSPLDWSDLQFFRMEAYVAHCSGLASRMYPDLFTPMLKGVDKDGLTDYQMLRTRFREVQPGIFHDPSKDLLLFAHRFFRRSLSHRNKLNDYFLTSFQETVDEIGSAVVPRLRLDPDVLGHPASLLGLLELEYWHGPKFNNEIEAIDSGVAEHKANDRDRFFEGVDKTHIWWKPTETRTLHGELFKYRTFEIEELIEEPSAGLNAEYGCRYAHSEYSLSSASISHFDGAIRAYPEEAYFDRIDKMIDRAGKHSNYTKLFRFDGDMPVERWKRLLSDYFRGNSLVPEYFGGVSIEEGSEGGIPHTGSHTEVCELEQPPDALCAFVSIAPYTEVLPFALEFTWATLSDGSRLPVMETGASSIDAVFRDKTDLSDIVTAGPVDGRWNLARMVFGQSEDFPHKMYDIVSAVSSALLEDINGGRVHDIAVAVSWPYKELQVTLSIRGRAVTVQELLGRLFCIIDPISPPSAWIEALACAVKALDPKNESPRNFAGLDEGILAIARVAPSNFHLIVPESMRDELFRVHQPNLSRDAALD